MPSVVPAGSLADVIDLADDPPMQLQDRALPNVQQPLVLYIARVPGSKDVFLTAMKPQRKVVTAQDVRSSLYYLHVDSVDDYKLLQSEGPDGEQPEGKDFKTHRALNHQAGVRRKPVPQSPSRASSDQSEIPSLEHFPLQVPNQAPHGDAKAARKPVDQGIKYGHRSLDAPPALPPRKLLGPRTMKQGLHSIDSSALQNVPERQNIDTRRWPEQPRTTPPRLPLRMDPIRRKEMKEVLSKRGGDISEEQMKPVKDESLAEHCWEWERSWEQKHAGEAREELARINSERQESQEHHSILENTSLSLIRRYNGEQWNVGKIVSIGTKHRVAGIPGAAISIEILTKGYSKFTDPQDLDEHSSLLSTPGNVSRTNGELNNIFRRHFQNPENPQRPSPVHSPSFSEPQSLGEEGRSSFEHRQPSHDNLRPSTTDLSGRKASSSKGYRLQSPWNGLCEFTTGIAGRSLKCKHSYASINPTFGSGMFSAPISELRFNLPSSKALGTPAAKRQIPGTPRQVKRSSRFLVSHHRRYSSSQATQQSHDERYFDAKSELEDRLDLSLGQEHAGGGFGGKQAKLGKLIVEVEGLQMLDFVVAANMALWWKIYERIT